MKKFINNENKTLSIDVFNKHCKIKFEDFNKEFNNNIQIKLKKEEILDFILILEEFCKIEIKKEDNVYSEEISTYSHKDGVEKILTITSSYFSKKDKNRVCIIYLDSYTDKKNDDNYILLTQKKLAYFIGLLYGYHLYL